MSNVSGCLDLGDLGTISLQPIGGCFYCERPSSLQILTQAKPPANISRTDVCDRCIGRAVQEDIEELRRIADAAQEATE